MDTVEFLADARSGHIEIPAEYRDRFARQVKVILVTEPTKKSAPTLIDELLASPLSVPGFRPFTREELHGR